jgi:Zn-dependent protease
MLELSLIQKITICIIPILTAVTIHEAAHAMVAHYFGDSTAKMLGRLSLNPMKHIDPLGTIIFPLTMAVLTQFHFIFGWAKPVPINQNQLKNPRRDMIFVALAGPMSNIIMAFLWALCWKLSLHWNVQTSKIALFLLFTAQAGIVFNIILAILNLIPLPPLDGSRVVSNLLSPKYAITYDKIEPFGYLILIVLLFTGVLNVIIAPFYQGLLFVIQKIFGL